MRVVYRIAKAGYPVFDGTGASLAGGRWNSVGHPVIYAAECVAGSLLEILVYAGRRARLPGRHHCARAVIPEGVAVEVLSADVVAGWQREDSPEARDFGERWLSEARSVALSVPAVAAVPYGPNILLNPKHPEYALVRFESPMPMAWDAPLFRL